VPRISPTLEGFRAAFRRPSFTLAEIAWRWVFGATACALLAFGLIEYLKTLPVTNADLFLLHTRHPVFVGQALAHILRGSTNRVVIAGLFGALALVCFWIVVASIGRIATIRGLRDYFRDRIDTEFADESAIGKSEAHPVAVSRAFRSLLGLNFLRAAVALAALAGFHGATILAGFASPEANPQPGLTFLLFLPLVGLICLAWWVLNWFLSLAAIFSVRDGENTLSAVSAAVALCRERVSAVFAVSAGTGVAHIVVFFVATTVGTMLLAFLQFAPRLVVPLVLLVTLSYFVIVDWLYISRLAGYICIVDMPETLSAPLLPIAPLTPRTIQTSIDRNELILSDIPLIP
jgi:hypothetical protein